MNPELWDDLLREVHGIFGIPVDMVDRKRTLEIVRDAARRERPFLLSTPNLNFLVQSLDDESFRDSLLRSDLCTADGMPIVWLARLLGAQATQRVAGSDLFDALRDVTDGATPMKVFLFGGPEGVAERACRMLNASQGGATCAGWLYPGFADVEDMSSEAIISEINNSRADFLAVSLGAKKGQSWLIRNHERLTPPIRVHLGATINFQSGDVRRAPAILRRIGLEWLWRIKQEPYLWRRYWRDGCKLISIVVTRALPLITLTWIATSGRGGTSLHIVCRRDNGKVVLQMSGHATARNIREALSPLRQAIAMNEPIVIDMSSTEMIDSRFTGLLLMMRKQVLRHGEMRLTNVPRRIQRLLELNGFGYLLEPGEMECR